MSSGTPFTSSLFAEGVEGACQHHGDCAELTHLHFVKSCYTSSAATPAAKELAHGT